MVMALSAEVGFWASASLSPLTSTKLSISAVYGRVSRDEPCDIGPGDARHACGRAMLVGAPFTFDEEFDPTSVDQQVRNLSGRRRDIWTQTVLCSLG